MRLADLTGVKGEGDLVEAIRDGKRVYGLVVAAGPSRYMVRWADGLGQRREQGDPKVALVQPEYVNEAMAAVGDGP